MNQENNIIIPSFTFSIKEYLQIFNINSLLTLNNFFTTRLSSDMVETTVLRIFLYGMYEYQKSIINSPEVSLNIITKVLKFIKKSEKDNDKIYRMILNAKNINDFEIIRNYID
jgi:hypothetical protein